MKHKTRELTGALLDRAVAAAEDVEIVLRPWGPALEMGFDPKGTAHEFSTKEWKMWLAYRPSSDWRQGGPIVERERLDIMADTPHEDWPGDAWSSTASATYRWTFGPSPLIAAMRAYVLSKLGEEVDLAV